MGESLNTVAGFAVMLGCRFRGAPASPTEDPRAYYEGVDCGFPGEPAWCSPAECPLVKLATERISTAVQDQALRGIIDKASGIIGGWFGGKAPDDEGGQ